MSWSKVIQPVQGRAYDFVCPARMPCPSIFSTPVRAETRAVEMVEALGEGMVARCCYRAKDGLGAPILYDLRNI